MGQSKNERMKELVSLLNKASRAYYQEAQEIMSNYEYDRLYDELKELEDELGITLSNSPTVNVGYEVVSELPKERHESPMLSLDKTKEVEELKNFVGDQKVLMSWKMDGLTVVLTYRDGKLYKAVTRGNGEVGEVITNNAKGFKNVPVQIAYQGELILRGEAVIGYKDFEKINQEIEDVDARYKNPRNLCKGKFTGVVPPLGYQKDPEEKGHLLIDDETAPIVRKIFQWAVDGHGINFISRELERQQIPCPSWWHRKRGLRTYYTKWEKKDPENGKYVWDESYLKSLLMNPVYCGDMASQKRYYRFKIGNQGDKAPEDWITVRDTHEAIIPQDVFALVQAKMKGRKRQTEQGEYSMFAGLLRCAECGGALTLKKTHTKDQHEVYTCSTYIHKGKAHCTQHRVDADDLYDAVLTRIQECAKAVTGDGTELENRVKELCEEDTQGHRDSLEKLVSKQKDRLETLDRLIAKLYDDLINDKITESVFDKMLEKTQKEQTDIKKELSQNQSVLNTEEKLDAQSQQWIDDISEYADIKELDANLLNRLISKIVISEPQEKDGKENYRRTPETVTMEIHFNLKPIPELGTIERGSGSHK